MSRVRTGSISAVDLKQVAGGKSPGRRGRRGQRGRTRSDLLLLDVTVQHRAVNLNEEPKKKKKGKAAYATHDEISSHLSSAQDSGGRGAHGASYRMVVGCCV